MSGDFCQLGLHVFIFMSFFGLLRLAPYVESHVSDDKGLEPLGQFGGLIISEIWREDRGDRGRQR